MAIKTNKKSNISVLKQSEVPYWRYNHGNIYSLTIYAPESPNLTVAQVLGFLEIAKIELIEQSRNMP